MFLTRSHRMELLVDALSEVVGAPRSRLFEPSVVVVQSLGIERWLAQQISSRLGVWLNARCPFPRAFVRSLLDEVLGTSREAARWERETLTWTIARRLATLDDRPAFSPLRRYLARSPDLRSRISLATRIAQAFDQYQAYRPDFLSDWEQGRAESGDAVEPWQGELFRLLLQELGPSHFAARVNQGLQVLALGGEVVGRLPERVCLFAVASVPPLFVQLFEALGRVVEVHWFLLSAGLGGSPQGSSLLDSLGHTLSDFESVLVEAEATESRALAPDGPDPMGSLLEMLQADLRWGRSRGGDTELPRLPLAPSDVSIRVHSCHGPRRELEVLRETLLDAFERDPSLGPEDVLVMLRDVEAYAPLVESVFGQKGDAPNPLPFSLVDRAERIQNEALGALVAILMTLHLRLTASAVGALLELGPLRRRFGLDEASVPTLCRWMEELELRWGVDGNDRIREGQPAYEQRTLRTGLRRLLLGVACDPSASHPFASVMPLPSAGDEPVLVAHFGEFLEALFDWQLQLSRPRPLSEWEKTLGELVSTLLALPPEQSWQSGEILRTLAELSAHALEGAFTENVGLDVVRSMLRERFEQPRALQPFLSGGITFSAMLPMRGIPFRFIAMLGLDDGLFPRQAAQSSIDGLLRARRVGDRSVRDEDWHLFLETLLGARERLVLSYVGQSPRDDATLPASVVVEELLAELDRGFFVVGDEARRPSQVLHVVHPLRAESPRYFDGQDPRLVSRSACALRGARAAGSTKRAPSGRLTQLLAPRTLESLDAGALGEFLGAPGEVFLRERLGVGREWDAVRLRDHESTSLNALEQWKVRSALVRATLAKHEGITEELRSRGWLPPGTLGELSLDGPRRDAEALAETVLGLGWSAPVRRVEAALFLDGLVLGARIDDVRPGCRIDLSVSRAGGRDRVVAYVKHLVLAAHGEPLTTWLVRRHHRETGRVSVEQFSPLSPDEAKENLSGLIGLYQVGMRGPLPFFVDLGYDYARERQKGVSASDALGRARLAFEAALEDESQQRHVPPWSDALARLFGGEPPLDDDWPARQCLLPLPSFAEVSAILCEPLLGCLVSGEACHADAGGTE